MLRTRIAAAVLVLLMLVLLVLVLANARSLQTRVQAQARAHGSPTGRGATGIEPLLQARGAPDDHVGLATTEPAMSMSLPTTEPATATSLPATEPSSATSLPTTEPAPRAIASTGTAASSRDEPALAPIALDRVLFVLAASKEYFCSLGLAVVSVRRHHPEAQLRVYDLGLRAAQRKWLARIPRVTVRRFAFEQYPPHLNVSVAAGQYAWKPAVLVEAAADSSADIIVWMDAGDALLSPLTPHWPAVWAAGGVYSSVTSGTVATWTHPGMLAALGITAADAAILSTRNCDAAFLIFFPRRVLDPLLKPWLACALDLACIAPSGSNRSNHRQDQAALTLLIRQQPDRFATCRPPPYDDPIRASYGSHLDHVDNRPSAGPCGRRVT